MYVFFNKKLYLSNNYIKFTIILIIIQFYIITVKLSSS